MDLEVNLVSVAIAAANLLLWVCFLLSWMHCDRRTRCVQRELSALRQQLVAVESGSFGVGKSLLRLEQQARKDAAQSPADHTFVSYKEAAGLLEAGADSSYLVNKLGMSRSEADLVVLLHPHLAAAEDGAVAATEAAGAG